jgi:hypothetical protein
MNSSPLDSRFVFPSPPAPHTRRALAEFWAVSPDTIANWQARGAPLENTEAMLVWISQLRPPF